MTKKKIKMDLSLMNDCSGEDFQGAKQLVAFRSGHQWSWRLSRFISLRFRKSLGGSLAAD